MSFYQGNSIYSEFVNSFPFDTILISINHRKIPLALLKIGYFSGASPQTWWKKVNAVALSFYTLYLYKDAKRYYYRTNTRMESG
jgi:hypothetical protein